MSSTCGDNVTEEGAFGIENILADFFLKKFNMPSSQSDKSDSNRYERRSKPKRKKHKKKSKHKHKSKDHSIERETSIYGKKEILDNSSSEEKEIKRLKKIKQLEGRSNKLWVPPTTTDIASSSAVQDIPNSKNCIDFNDDPIGIPYGPSIELLLTGVDSAHQENPKPVMGLDFVSVPVETVDSAIETNSSKAEISNDTSNVVICDEIVEKSADPRASLMPIAECDKNSMTPVKDEVLCSKEQSSQNLCKTDLQQHCDQNVSRKKHSSHKSKSQSKHKSSTKDRLRSRSRSKTHENSKYESSSSRNRKNVSESHVGKSDHSKSHSRKSKSSSRERKRNKTYSRERSRSNSCNRSKSRRYSRSRSKESQKKRKHSESRISHKSQRLHSRSSEDEYLSKSDLSRSREKKYQHRSRAHRHRSRSGSESSCEKRKSSRKSQERFNRTSDSRRKSRENNSSPEHKKIDQAKILEVAKKKLQSMIEKGTLPEGLSLQTIKKEELASIKAGGKSVQELTDFCVKLSKKENEEDVANGAGTKEEEGGDEDEDDFIHHPFRLKEPSVLKLNIKNAVQIPIKTHAEKVAETARLSSQFPVSSGNQHKQKELEWIPVEPEKSKPNPKPNSSQVTTTLNVKEPNVQASNPAVCEPTVSEPVPPNVDLPLIPMPAETSATVISFSTPTPVYQTAISPVSLTSSSSNYSAQSESPVFKPPKFLDVTSIVTKRFNAVTKLKANPNDQAALIELQEAQTSIQEWVQSQQVPGQFTGSTDAKLLSVEELCGPKSFRLKKDIFTQAAPVTEGKGMSLLKKMGWNPGEGLGKNKEGSLEPLVLSIKTDKK
ncbi:protein SON-like, partial [Stegodyphus dumicola]|uniref:protein SON-like n=1 Tax=Stegodyphus dumicola TaxID=202533 RepID=UPI0015A8DE17